MFVTEGQFDAISIEQLGFKAVSIGGVGSGKLIGILKTMPARPVLIVAFDNDEAGNTNAVKLSERLASELDETGVIHIVENLTMDTSVQGASVKDISEALAKDADALRIRLKEASDRAMVEASREALEYMKNSAAGYLQAFVDGVTASASIEALPTGFGNLDHVLGDGLYEGLYTLGAISSLGKTAFVMQIVDSIAKSCAKDILVFALEMGRFELMARSISRLTYLKCLEYGEDFIKNAKTVRGILNGSRYKNYFELERNLISESVKKYGTFADRIFIYEGIGDIGIVQIKEALDKHVRLTGNNPIVVVDYLQLLAPYNERYTDKQNIDKAVLELKRISRDYKIPVLAISSFNRAAYGDKVSMEAFKESGAIEYSSDVLLGMQLKNVSGDKSQAEKEMRNKERSIEVKVLKNRSGRLGEAYFKYFSMFNCFKEE